MIARNASRGRAGFTLIEMLVAAVVFGVFMAALLRIWNTLGATAMNTTAYAQRQNDQMRVFDYLKRDIRRATNVEIYNGATLVTGTTTFGSELRLTIPDYYSDSREEDNAIGTKVPNTPAVVSGDVAYGATLTVRYYALNGAGIRDEAGTARTVASAAGAFVLSFKRETSGAIRSRVFFDQPMRGRASQTLRRTVETICIPRFELQL
ncbi:MAG: prepilin-type N-terminal cleavage/methylation domain-containing protein [Chthoniobacteraceae bacterium]